MLTLHVEAPSLPELIQAVANALPANVTLHLNALRTTDASAADVEAARATDPAPAEEPTKRRGRPRGSKHSETTQPAVVENTGSAPAAESLPAVEDAKDSAEGETSAPVETVASPGAAVSITFDEFRAKVQSTLETLQKGDEGAKAMDKIATVLAKHGCKKVRDPKPEQYPAIVADLDALVS